MNKSTVIIEESAVKWPFLEDGIKKLRDAHCEDLAERIFLRMIPVIHHRSELADLVDPKILARRALGHARDFLEVMREEGAE